jgi:hypothetical protein
LSTDFTNNNIKTLKTPLKDENIISIASTNINNINGEQIIKIAIQTDINLYISELSIINNQLIESNRWNFGKFEAGDCKIIGYDNNIIVTSN